MTEDIEVGRFSQAAPDLAAEFKEEKDTTMGAEGTKRQPNSFACIRRTTRISLCRVHNALSCQ